jgi:outer membrane autotransporter protein
MANDTMTVGVALTAAKTDLKHKNVNAGDKTKADTLMFSIYGVQQVTDNWFVQGIASFGSSKIKNSAKRVGSVNGVRINRIASAKYDSMSYGGEVLAGYNHKFSDMALVTPMAGLAYTKFNDSGYTETGTRNQNQTVSKKSTDKLEAIVGAIVAMATEVNGITITPEVHGFIRQSLTNKTPKVDMRLDGMVNQITPKTTKAAKTFYNVGLGFNARAGMMEYGAGYDAHMANKYVAHQGTLKVRVNF